MRDNSKDLEVRDALHDGSHDDGLDDGDHAAHPGARDRPHRGALRVDRPINPAGVGSRDGRGAARDPAAALRPRRPWCRGVRADARHADEELTKPAAKRRGSRERAERPARRARWPWVAAAVVALAALGVWLATRPQPVEVGRASGTTLAAYRPADLHSLQASPTDERPVFFGHHRGMLVSQDRGATWTAVSGASGDAMGVSMAPGSRTEFVAGHDVFLRSDDGGRTWSSQRPALPGTDIHG